jgi:hypothetical protein
LGENNLDISAKFCPVCKNKNDRDAIICVHCGASLETFYPESATTRTTDVQTTFTGKVGEWLYDESAVPAGSIAIYVEGAPKPIFLSSEKEIIVGRKVEETSQVILDLSTLGGYHLGLSRLHAVIRRAEHGYEIMDFGSSNGTWLNDERLIPHRPYPLTNGSQLRLARMRLFIVYHPLPETKSNNN